MSQWLPIFLFKKFTTLAAVAKNISFCVWTERPREHRRLVSSVARQRGANRRSRRAAEAGFKVLLIKKVTQKGRRRSYFTEAKLLLKSFCLLKKTVIDF